MKRGKYITTQILLACKEKPLQQAVVTTKQTNDFSTGILRVIPSPERRIKDRELAFSK